MPLRIKRDLEKKARLAICGNFEKESDFPPGSCFAPNLGDNAIKFLVAFAVYFGFCIKGFDVTQCFAYNEWADTERPRKICILLDGYASGTGEPELMAVGYNQYGFRDAPNTWSRVSDREFESEKFGFTQSKVARKVFWIRRGLYGFLAFGLTTDDGLIIHSNDEDGRALYEELVKNLLSKWKCTFQSPLRDYTGIKFDYNNNGSVTLTQPSQVEAVRAHFFPDGQVPETFLALPKDWSPESSQLAQRSNVKSYMQDIGTVGYMRLTMPESNTFSLLSSQSKNPSVEDKKAVRHFAAFIITRKAVGITYHPSEGSRNINECVNFHCFTDASPGDNLDGSAQISWLIKMGPRGHPGGAVIMKNIK